MAAPKKSTIWPHIPDEQAAVPLAVDPPVPTLALPPAARPPAAAAPPVLVIEVETPVLFAAPAPPMLELAPPVGVEYDLAPPVGVV